MNSVSMISPDNFSIFIHLSSFLLRSEQFPWTEATTSSQSKSNWRPVFIKSEIKVNISSTNLHQHDQKLWRLSVQLLQPRRGQEDAGDGGGRCQGQCEAAEDVQEASETSSQSWSSGMSPGCYNRVLYLNLHLIFRFNILYFIRENVQLAYVDI